MRAFGVNCNSELRQYRIPGKGAKDRLDWTYVDSAFVKWFHKVKNAYFHSKRKQRIMEAFDLLSDDFSCYVMYCMMYCYLSGNLCLKDITTYPQYFIPEI